MLKKTLIPRTRVARLFRKNQIMVIVALLFLSIATISAYLCYRHYQTISRQLLQDDRKAAGVSALILEEHLLRIMKTLDSYAQRPSLVRAAHRNNEASVKPILADLVRHNPDIDIIVITDAAGTIWASYPDAEWMTGKNFAYRDWYRGVSRNWKPYISDANFRLRGEKDTAVHIAVPILDERQQTVAVFVNTQRAAALADVIRRAPLELGSALHITDRKGTLVYSNALDYARQLLPYDLYPTVKGVKTGAAQTFLVADSQKKCFVSAVQVAGLGWRIFVERDHKTIRELSMPYFLQTGVAGGLLFLALTLMLFLFEKTLRIRFAEKELAAQDAIIQSERKYSTLYESMIDGFVSMSMDGKITGSNHVFREMLGYNKEELALISYPALTPASERDLEQDIIKHQVLEKGYSEIYEKTFIRKDQTVFPAELHAMLLSDPDGRASGLWSMVRDITKRKEAENQIRKINRILTVEGQINQMMLHVRNKDLLFAETCRILVEHGDFQMAWVGWINEQAASVDPLAFAGHEEGYLSVIRRISTANIPEGRGPTGSSIRGGATVYCNDIANDQRMEPWRDEALSRGYRSSIALPLKQDECVAGALNIYSRLPGFFTATEIKMLEEVAENISYALELMASEGKRRQAENYLREANEQLEQRVIQRTAELSRKNEELTRLNRVFVDRELRMRELKEKIAELEKKMS